MSGANHGKLKEIFDVILDLPADTDVTKVRRITEDRWDSLAHTSIVAAIESEFGIRLGSQDAERITSFAAAELLLSERVS